MSRILVEGFRNLANWNVIVGYGANAAWPTCDNSDTDFEGQYYVEITGGGSGLISLSRAISPTSLVYVSFFIKFGTALSQLNSLIQFCSGSRVLGYIGTSDETFNGFGIKKTDGDHLVFNYDYGPGDIDDDLYHVEVYYKPHYTSGEAELKVNGISMGTFSGQTSDYSDNPQINRIIIGNHAGIGNFPSCKIAGLVVDDADWVGHRLVMSQLPNGAGTNSGFTPEPSGNDNYEKIDDYEYTQIGGHKLLLQPEQFNRANAAPIADSFQIESIPCRVATISSIATNIKREKRFNLLLNTIKSLVLVDGNEHLSDELGLMFSSEQHILELNPETGFPWTEEEVNNIEVGYKVE
jgi:hypothetical protein